jgi:hypothetical protein
MGPSDSSAETPAQQNSQLPQLAETPEKAISFKT